MATGIRTPQPSFTLFQKMLFSKREEIRNRFQKHRQEVVTEREPDDEAAEANHNFSKDLAIAILEREENTLEQIEVALDKIKRGNYGACDECGQTIPAVRLRALPWTRFCLGCSARAGDRPCN
ncbi:MAG: TraR/DksA family transcriptional regulator [Candidatus Acidiferrales bacterium]